MRLLYRFYDGQDYSALVMPLFGSYFMYGEATTAYFLRSPETKLNKITPFVGCYAHMKAIVVDDESGFIYSYGGNRILFPAAPHDSECPLFDWLDNFVGNLERRVFAIEPIDMNDPEVNGTDRDFHTVVTYPLPRGSSNTTNPPAVRDFSSSVITNGIEVRAAYVFAPEKSTKNKLVFIYTIRMRLIADHPTRLSRMVSCRLLRRHWRVNDGASGKLKNNDEYDQELQYRVSSI